MTPTNSSLGDDQSLTGLLHPHLCPSRSSLQNEGSRLHGLDVRGCGDRAHGRQTRELIFDRGHLLPSATE